MKERIKKIIYLICPYICGALYGVLLGIAFMLYLIWIIEWHDASYYHPWPPKNLDAYIIDTIVHWGIILLCLAAIVVNLIFNIRLLKKAHPTKGKLFVTLIVEVLLSLVTCLPSAIITCNIYYLR